MVELIIVMVLISVLCALALPVFNSRTPVNEMGMRDQVGALLEYCRKLAVVQQRSVCVVVLAAQRRILAVYAPAPGNVCAIGSPVERTVSDNPLNGPGLALDIPLDVVMGGAQQVQFAADGRLLPNANQTITMGPRSVTVLSETSLVTYY